MNNGDRTPKGERNRKRLRRFFLALALLTTIGAIGRAADAATRDQKNDRRDTITCSARTTEDSQLMLRFERLADGRARVTFACP